MWAVPGDGYLGQPELTVGRFVYCPIRLESR